MFCRDAVYVCRALQTSTNNTRSHTHAHEQACSHADTQRGHGQTFAHTANAYTQAQAGSVFLQLLINRATRKPPFRNLFWVYLEPHSWARRRGNPNNSASIGHRISHNPVCFPVSQQKRKYQHLVLSLCRKALELFLDLFTLCFLYCICCDLALIPQCFGLDSTVILISIYLFNFFLVKLGIAGWLFCRR